MSDYLVFKDEVALSSGSPVTHAIIIGVGGYPHLNGGDPNALADLHGGLGQLSSPPVSAREFTTWLLDAFDNPDKPLATVSLLISEKEGPQAYTHAKLSVPFSPQPATLHHVKSAVRAWKRFGDDNEESLMLFFFCGHGVARGLVDLTLLLGDYGEDKDMPMDGAVDFSALHRGMSQCAASHQCYFVDACRTVSDIATRTTAKGQQIIQDNTDRPWASDWQYTIFFSTLGGEKAYGRKTKPSFYTEELINGLNGTGSNNRSGDGSWWVTTGDLSIALHRGLSQRGKKIKVPLSEQVHFKFHRLRHEPVVPVMVYCRSDADTERAEFTCLKDGDAVDSRAPKRDKWKTEVPHGTYDFLAEVDTRKGERTDESIMPPYRDIEIKVEAVP
jgi:hypothetical protein